MRFNPHHIVVSSGLLEAHGKTARAYYILRSLATDPSGSVSLSSEQIFRYFGKRTKFNQTILDLKALKLVRSTQEKGSVYRVWLCSPKRFLEENDISPGICFNMPRGFSDDELIETAAKVYVDQTQTSSNKAILKSTFDSNLVQDFENLEFARILAQSDILQDTKTILPFYGGHSEKGSKVLGYVEESRILIALAGQQIAQISQQTIARKIGATVGQVQKIVESWAKIRLAFWNPKVQSAVDLHPKFERELNYPTVKFRRGSTSPLICQLGCYYYLGLDAVRLVKKNYYKHIKNNEVPVHV